LNESSVALLALHFQNDVLHVDGKIRVGIDDEAHRAKLIDHARRLLADARNLGWLIVHVRVAFRPDYADLPRNMPIFGRVADIGAVQDGSWGADFFDTLAPLSSDREFVVTHKSISAFRGTHLDSLLRQHRIARVVAAGVATHSVVESTVRDAAEHGYDVSVVADACTAASRTAHDAALASMALMADVTTFGSDAWRVLTQPIHPTQ